MKRVWLFIASLAGAMQPAMAAPPRDPIEAAFVVIGPHGQATTRVVTSASACPRLLVDGRGQQMAVRAEPATEPLRPTRSTPENSKPSAFPVLVCDAAIPPHSRAASIGGHRLPLPKAEARRIVVIGDTGCRLKASDEAWQACNDPTAYPFATIARRAAAWHPDLVIHVGDYLYRENPCRPGDAGCAGSPWGYGWDAWDADLFAPGRALFAAAPWVVVRGNHENCDRAGQGWWRLLDPRPPVAGRDCNDPANDVTGDYSPAYAVPLGRGAQVVVMDLSHAGEKPFEPGDPRIGQFGETWRELAGFARHASFTFAADHYPLFGVAAEHARLEAGNPALQTVFAAQDPRIVPSGVDALLAGHIHVWEQLDFGGVQPSQFVAGFSGTQEDIVPLPKTLPPEVMPAPDAPVRRFDAIVDRFGFMTLERTGRTSWAAEVHGIDGKVLRHCLIRGRRSNCAAA